MKLKRTIATALLAPGIFAGAFSHAEYLAYAVGQGSRLPLPESIEAIDAHYLVELHWTYRGGRSAVAVMPVTNPRGTAAQETGEFSGEGVPLAEISAAVLETMRRTGRFEVDVNTSSAPERVPFKGYRMQVSVAAYESSVATRISNPRALRTQRAAVKKGRVALRMRLVGPAGEVVVVGRYEAVIEAPRSEFSGTSGGLPADLWRTSVGQATAAAINKGVYAIVKAVGPLPASGRVVKVEDDRLWVNLGASAVSVGDELEVIATSEVLIDPATGLDLGGVETTLATLRVVTVEERFCVGEKLLATGTASRGDRVRSMSAPPAFEFSPVWDPPGREAF